MESCPVSLTTGLKQLNKKLYEMLINDKLNTLLHSHNLLGHAVVVDHESTYEYVNTHHHLSRQLNYGLSQLYGNLYHK